MKGWLHTHVGIERRDLVPAEVEGVRVLVRKDWGPDMGVLLEWKPTYRRMQHVIAGHDVLDIGANIGMFSTVALAMGAESVVCYEPEPGAFSVLRANLGRSRRALLINAAIGVKHGGTLCLAVPRSGNATAASTYYPPARGRQTLQVAQHGFLHAIATYGPSLVKLDCEGEELNFLDGRKLPSHVRVVTGELHREGDGNEDRCAKVIASFSKWTPIHPPAHYSFKRCWTVAWMR